MTCGDARQRTRSEAELTAAVAKTARLENTQRWSLPGDDRCQNDDDGAYGEISFMLEPAH